VNSLTFNCVSVTYYQHYSCIFHASTWSCNFRSSIFWSSIFRSRIFHLLALPQICSSIFQSCIFRLLFFFGPSLSGPAFLVHPEKKNCLDFGGNAHSWTDPWIIFQESSGPPFSGPPFSGPAFVHYKIENNVIGAATCQTCMN